jgi:Outer membrane protein beta-barrel domain
MKKFIVIPMLVLSSGLFAQGFQFGLKGGVNVSNFSGSSSVEDVKKKAYVGFHAGGLFAFWVGHNVAIQPEVLFSSVGAKYKNAVTEQNFKASYLTVPLMFKARFNGGFYLEAGPQVGFKLSDNATNRSAESFAKDLDLAIDAGLGFQSTAGFGVGVRYVVGVSKVGDFDPAADLPNVNAKTGVAQAFVFVTLFNSHKTNP